MSSILNITLPIFLLIGLGYGLVRSGLFNAAQFRALGRIIVSVALPALIILTLSNSSVSEVFNFQYIAAYAGGSLVVLFVGLTIGLWLRRRPLTVAAIRSLGMSNSNSAFVSFPVAYQLLGARYGQEGPCAAALLATTMASFVTLSVWVWLIGHGMVG